MKFLTPLKQKLKGKKKLTIAIIVAVVVVLFFLFKPKNQSLPMVSTVPLEKGDIVTAVDVSGKIEANDSAEITAPYNYKVTDISVKEGDLVEKGQVLATLDSQSLIDEITLLQQEIASDQMRINEGYDNLNYIDTSTEALELAIQDAKASYDQAVTNEQRQKHLYAAGAISLAEYEKAQNDVSSADIALSQAQESLEKAQFDIDSRINSSTPKDSEKMALEAKKTMLSQKQRKLDDLSVRSPINGTVTRVYSKVGRLAQDTENNKPMFVIEDNSAKYLSAEVGEYDISKILEGQQAKITSNVLGNDSVAGIVERVSPTAEMKQNSNSMAVPVKILVTKPDERLITGVTAKANIKIEEKKDIFKVPYECLANDGEKYYIYTVENSKLKKIYITKGLESDFDSEIKSSELKVGMPIVSTIEETYNDQMPVHVLDENMGETVNGDKQAENVQK